MDSKELSPKDSGQSGVLDRLPFNLTQLLAFAMQKPRNPIAALEGAIAQLRAAPQFASKAYYTIPFTRKDGSKEVVEGPSIKAATALTGCWGNNVEGGFLGEETDDYIDVSGYFFDYETGKLTIRPWRVSKTYRTREGKVVKWRYDMLLKQIQAGVSKAIRNAALNGLPPGYIAEYYAEAKRIAARGGKVNPAGVIAEDDVSDIDKQIEKCVSQFEQIGVTREDVAKYIGRHSELGNEEEVASHLVGLLNALAENATTVEDIFSVPDEPIPAPTKESAIPLTPKSQPLSITKVLPEKRTRMQSRFGGVSCKTCHKPMEKGDWIYKNERDSWAHEVGPNGGPC